MSTQPKTTPRPPAQTAYSLAAYLCLGIAFGVVLTKSEVLSWFRIQEMFRFQSPRMYEIIVSAIVVAGLSLALIRRFDGKTISGERIVIPPKNTGYGVRYARGGTTSDSAGHLQTLVPGHYLRCRVMALQ